MTHVVYLTRRNLQTLLNKLDRVAEGGASACEIVKFDNSHPHYPQTMDALRVIAVENEAYYDRPAGPVLDEDDPDRAQGHA